MIAKKGNGSIQCNSCTLCCENRLNGQRLEIGVSEASFYETVEDKGRFYLRNGPIGCIYVQPRIGCSIYERRPRVCRLFDCRIAVAGCNIRDQHAAIAQGIWSVELVRKARQKLSEA